MCKTKKSTMKKIPVFLVGTIVIVSGLMKITGIHPMLDHFITMGISPAMIKLLGAAEIIFTVLLMFPATAKIGLLLLTAYFGGAMAAEIPFGQVMAPMIPLALVWIAAFVRAPSYFLRVIPKNSANLSTPNP